MVLDGAGAVEELLRDNWDSDNTDSKTPVVNKVLEVKEVSIATKDRILTYLTNRNSRFNGIGSRNFKIDIMVTIDLRSSYKPNKDKTLSTLSTVTGNVHLLKMVEEVERIIKLKADAPGGGFQVIMPDGNAIDLSDKFKNLYRHTYEVMLKQTNY